MSVRGDKPGPQVLMQQPNNRLGVEVEQTGASSQFYDKFSSSRASIWLILTGLTLRADARRNIAYIFKAIWGNPVHRQALDNEAK